MFKSFQLLPFLKKPKCHDYTTEELITKSFNNADIVLFSNQIGQMNMEKGKILHTPKQSFTNGQENGDLELPLFDFTTINYATDNFSIKNVLGQGGFGPLYKKSPEHRPTMCTVV
ncbi:putative serine/threonine-protein kinase receptor [Quercus lobata]|uniref:putative serine/threonine-protein kinase receptor n=1 Tax=Quercus lobata TaxID=97700 RepID=UPI001248BD4E|nr:putative serine/threonine-protein kinase receptor [Quercus lobata]